jgi:tetratricopeptide (TPR) repeat protein
VEPFGTITKYYPFLSDDTRDVVENLLENALNYYDFIHSLVDAADSYPMESELAFFALNQSTLFPDSWGKMEERCPDSVVTKPITYLRWDSLDPIPKDHLEEFEHSMNEAVSSTPFEWIRLHLYSYAGFESPEPLRTKYFENIRLLVEARPELHCFSEYLHQGKAMQFRAEGNIEKSLQYLDKAFEIATEHDDVISAASILSIKANTVKDIDIHRALQLHDEAYSMIAERLTEFDATYMFALSIGMTYEAMGEYDLALAFCQKDFELLSKFADHARIAHTLVACRVCCELGMPQQALEWLISNSASMQFEDSYLHSIAAKVFILLGQLDDAARHLVRANNMAMESGDDSIISSYLLARALYELASDELDAASSSLQEVLTLSSPQFQIIVNYALLGLTQVEATKAVKAETSGLNIHTSGPWMSKLEEHALERNFPGIRMQHAILKADYQTRIGEHEAAMHTLNTALNISDSPGLKTFRKKINERLGDLEEIINESI